MINRSRTLSLQSSEEDSAINIFVRLLRLKFRIDLSNVSVSNPKKGAKFPKRVPNFQGNMAGRGVPILRMATFPG
jgi:hypothetical protein